MAERPPLMPVRRPRGPSPQQVRRRRLAALTGTLLIPVGIVAAVVWALPRVSEEPAPTTVAAPPPPKPFRIIFPEGFTRKQMAERVAAVKVIAERKRRGKKVALTRAGYIATTAKNTVPCFTPKLRRNLEGFLFPATYDFLRTTTSRQLVANQIAAFCRNWKKVDLRYARSKNLTPYDVLIVASMIERETLAPDERPLVSAVIYNRLKARMTLGIDATLRYGLGIPATEPIRQSQLQSDTPYNTRRFPGLTPTPIGNPGLASIQAAAHPAKVKYLYFVRKPDRIHHFFTSSESEFFRKACEYGFGCG